MDVTLRSGLRTPTPPGIGTRLCTAEQVQACLQPQNLTKKCRTIVVPIYFPQGLQVLQYGLSNPGVPELIYLDPGCGCKRPEWEAE